VWTRNLNSPMALCAADPRSVQDGIPTHRGSSFLPGERNSNYQREPWSRRSELLKICKASTRAFETPGGTSNSESQPREWVKGRVSSQQPRAVNTPVPR
jgi:hypothetical protein